MRVQEIVKESLASALPYQQKVGRFIKADNPEVRNYQFTIDDMRYDVRFNSDNMGKDWEFVFTANTPRGGVYYTKTHTGHQQQVFATVIKILRDFLNEMKPDSVMFSADKDEEGRVKLYHRLIKRFEPELNKIGYKIDTSKQPNAMYADFRIEKIKDDTVNELKKYSHTGQGYQNPRTDREAWRGPHEGKELAMMLDNVKPAALITGLSWPSFEPYIKQGRFIGKPMQGRHTGSYLVAQPDEKWRLDKIEKIIQDFNLETDNLDLYTARLGRLLGYDKEHIRKFINLR